MIFSLIDIIKNYEIFISKTTISIRGIELNKRIVVSNDLATLGRYIRMSERIKN